MHPVPSIVCVSSGTGRRRLHSPPFSLPTESLSTAIPSPSVLPLPIGMIEVAFVKDGNIQIWDEGTQQIRTIVNTGDVFSVVVSDDGQMIVFTRGSWVGDVFEGYEQFALWVISLYFSDLIILPT
jgi:hypothetical protein